MSNLETSKLNEKEDASSSQSSDEKMDTGSESFLSTQNTPNSVLSSEFDDKDQADGHNKTEHVLRLQDPVAVNGENGDVLRLSGPDMDKDNCNTVSIKSLNDSLCTKISKLRIDSLDVDDNTKSPRPKHLGLSPPKLASTLTLTTSHPLMGLGSPESVENFPDVVPERSKRNVIKIEEDAPKDLSLSSVEDNNLAADTNFLELNENGPQRNTSKSNLYFSENFSTADSQMLNDSTSPPDVARVHVESKDLEKSRRKIIPKFRETEISNSLPKKFPSTPQRALGRIVDGTPDESSILRYVEERNRKLDGYIHSTPKVNGTEPREIPPREDMHSGVAEWCESPSHLRAMPNFDLPIELSSSIGMHDEAESPDGLSSPSSEERSAYQARVDPSSGCAALRHTPATGSRRRKIVALVQADTEDRCSLDSVSGCSLPSEEEAAGERGPCEGAAGEEPPAGDQSGSDDDSRRNTTSDCSSPIPEYSAAEERRDGRAWLSVALPGGGRRACDMKVIEPYKRVLSHGGYGAGGAAVVVFAACRLPDCARRDYNYVMDNLFLYVVWTLERLVTEEYVVVYLHGASGAARRRLPTFHWLLHCYRLLDRRLRKNLKHLYLVHPSFWLKSVVLLSRPFVSSKFSRKLSYVKNLQELTEKVAVEPNAIPDSVREYDARA